MFDVRFEVENKGQTESEAPYVSIERREYQTAERPLKQFNKGAVKPIESKIKPDKEFIRKSSLVLEYLKLELVVILPEIH